MKSTARKILILDDDPFSLELYREAIGQLYTVSFMTDWEIAFNHLTTSQMDLVICDISLVGITGFDFAQRVRELPGYERLPFIFVSSFKSGRVSAAAHSFENAAFLSKEAEITELHSLIGTLLNR